MTGGAPDPELLREIATALRWAARGGAERVVREAGAVAATAPMPSRSAAASRSAASAPAPSRAAPAAGAPKGPMRLRDRPRMVKPARSDGAARLAAVQVRVAGCERCALHEGRTQIVFGSGPAHARLMIVGSGPGVAEDAAGELWQGAAGELLDRMLGAMGLFRAEVYLSSLVMCRLAVGQEPSAEAIKSCTPFLRSQLEAVAPDAVLVLGETAARFLMNDPGAMAELRGRWWSLIGRPAIASHGLEAVLADATLKRESWADLQQIMSRLGLRRS